MRIIVSLFVALGCLFSYPASAQPQVAPTVPVQIIETPGNLRLAPAPPTNPENLLYLDLSTGGRVVIWLRPDVAPRMVERIKTLTRQHFYDGIIFHRVIDGFMAQTGDPKGDGTGGSPLPDLKAEFNYLPHVRGAVSAARAEGEDSANSQFFIVFQPRLSLDKKYTVFGRVIEGMEFADLTERGEPPARPSKILHAYIGADSPPPYMPPASGASAVGASLGAAVDLPDSTPTKPKPPAKSAPPAKPKPATGPKLPR
ncbi:MAG: peptidylprolyl isomerase [Sphingomonas sp.]